uniref:Uncharacterized protein n=1 Tax=Trieres chinensis TaxID=1514140 RepID=A0A7S1ZM99_TRICV|mmetsp:Transcript_28537/g.58433  ORF Transcript_28537/g.58433 Transcript_28537/m.58433 type:complete len:170 (+) Transcript_28537:89-598(+)|eukprot:CAMPEP_0183291384 /NCGR_PEP_ID=MMETSP0160_2-20130417/825_1 /TAXON_ID=2839 ORGANISM="Odontella Sinensis, Strain Grunow 1884" /NCGR_SAMPLE_ID=MMETSP0160_2 /ASSEMBLY_ACC=CAM_ASM_000250 /LENGTH=169 /DNA_ID=CAMNT_0025452183 /DNA_START=83 /DNA_END=592 /DNA_ORIENTATION=+
MKVSLSAILLAVCCASATAFVPAAPSRGQSTFLTQRYMFSGAGAAAPKEDDPEAMAQLEKMASAMGMSVEEYQLGLRARVKMEESIDSLRVTGGDAEKGVTVERDGNTPSKHFVITITEDGKALGKEALEKELVAALKSTSDQAAKGRTAAQQNMMQFIAEEMKAMGAM